MNQETETENSDIVNFRVWVPDSVILRIDDLIRQPEMRKRFLSPEDFIGAALLSFLSYEEAKLRRERGLSY